MSSTTCSVTVDTTMRVSVSQSANEREGICNVHYKILSSLQTYSYVSPYLAVVTRRPYAVLHGNGT